MLGLSWEAATVGIGQGRPAVPSQQERTATRPNDAESLRGGRLGIGSRDARVEAKTGGHPDWQLLKGGLECGPFS